MTFDRQLVRLMGAMIVTIIVYLAPSAVQAHEGHAHHGHRQLAVAISEAAPTVIPTSSRTVTPTANAAIAVTATGTPGRAAAGSLRSDEQGGGCCPGPCKGTCCGTASCCVSGILTGAAALPMLAFGHVVMTSYDVSGLPGVGPEALSRPPRTLT